MEAVDRSLWSGTTARCSDLNSVKSEMASLHQSRIPRALRGENSPRLPGQQIGNGDLPENLTVDHQVEDIGLFEDECRCVVAAGQSRVHVDAPPPCVNDPVKRDVGGGID